MFLEPVSRFDLDRQQARTSTIAGAQFTRPLLRADGAGTGLYVEDGGLRGQFRCRHGYLLVIDSETCAWESGVQFLLLSAESTVLDAAQLHLAWVSGCVEDLSVASDDALDFKLLFRWRVTIRETSRWLPKPEEWLGFTVSRPKDYGPLRRLLDFDRLDRRHFWQR